MEPMSLVGLVAVVQWGLPGADGGKAAIAVECKRLRHEAENPPVPPDPNAVMPAILLRGEPSGG
jgi:hypothetical protein